MKKKTLLRLFIFNGLLFVAVAVLLQWNIGRYAAFQPVLTGEMQKLKILEEKINRSDLRFSQIGMDDASLSLARFKGSWVVVNFWATWCAPCIKELPSLEALQERYAQATLKNNENAAINNGFEAQSRQSLRVIAIAMDEYKNGQVFIDFLNKHKINGIVPQYIDRIGEINRNIRFRGFPTTWIINPNGDHIATLEGEVDWASADAFAFTDSLLGR